MAGTLGVSTIALAPFAFLNLLTPIISITMSYMGIYVLYKKDAKKGQL